MGSVRPTLSFLPPASVLAAATLTVNVLRLILTLTVFGTLIVHEAPLGQETVATVTARFLETLRLPASVLMVAAGLGVTVGVGVAGRASRPASAGCR